MSQSLAAVYCHIVFSTKGREGWIGPELEDRLYAYIGGIVGARKSALLAIGGMPDHVHLLISISREWAIADLVRDIKANSSNWAHRELAGRAPFAWQNGYGAFSVSTSGLAAVREYIANQKTHHANRSFQDEYRLLLEKHGLEYDERYVWD